MELVNLHTQIVVYCRSGSECIVKQLQMLLYKPDCNSNDCELPNEKATPSILPIEVWLGCEAVSGVGY